MDNAERCQDFFRTLHHGCVTILVMILQRSVCRIEVDRKFTVVIYSCGVKTQDC